MTQNLELKEVGAVLKDADNILILTHKNPDGDALGSALALTAALRSIGKKCNATWTGQLLSAFSVLTDEYEDMDFEPQFIMAVDLATPNLLPPETKKYADCVDLCIDHHGSNTGFAKMTYVDSLSSSCCEIIAQLLQYIDAERTLYIGSCIYVGLSTDTGCFKYSNTNADSHIMASVLAVQGVDIAKLNNLFFEQKSRGRIEIEKLALAGMEYTCDGKICFLTITRDMMDKSGCIDSDIEDLAGIPKSIEGVEAGITLREQKNGNFKISVRTKELDASEICAVLGGGGHKKAAGCECSGTPYDIKVQFVNIIKEKLKLT